jgi:CRP-like cAMP-binding protein
LVELARDQSEKVEGKGWILANSPTQEEMATRIGCTREHLNRAFKQFREEGIVMTEGRTIVIRKLKALKSAAGLD